jgi:mannose-6-phosphate isomerase-like protein (cupin superfamily)
MAERFDLTTTFMHLADGGGAEAVTPTRSFWAGSDGQRYDRVMGAFDFRSSQDLHASLQEMHPEADEVLLLVSGAIDVVVEEAGGERTIPLEAGQAAIVARGAWHRLVMRRPGRLVFVNNRRGIANRPHAASGRKDPT